MPDLGNTSVFSQTDASNNSGTQPSWSGAAAPSTIDDAARALQGAITREWNWRNYTLTAAGTADAKTLTYSVAPVAYYNGQRFAFIANTVNTTTCTLNVNALGAKTIKSMLTGTLANLAAGDMVAGMYVEVAYNTSNDCFVWVNQKTPTSALPTADATTSGIVELATTTETLTGTDATRAVTPDSLAALWEQGADVASAGTISLGEGGYFNITGTTTITDIDFATDKTGRKAWVKFAGALTLTHNATTLILPGGASITTAAGDTACFISEGADAVRCVSYNKASGAAVVAGTSGGMTLLGTITTTSGSSQSLGSLTLTNYKQLVLVIIGVSHTVSTTDMVLNDGTSDYTIIEDNGSAAGLMYGRVIIDLDSGHFSSTGYVAASFGSGLSIGAAGADGARFAAGRSRYSTASTSVIVGSTGTFDAGSVKVYGVA